MAKPIGIYEQFTVFGSAVYVAWYAGGEKRTFDHYPTNEELESDNA
ncbi:MAG: hypothetical protein LC650_00415 [Actinobacteria bacterium]|nr:hypothetical protein [Actinomycetota bacterium]